MLVALGGVLMVMVTSLLSALMVILLLSPGALSMESRRWVVLVPGWKDCVGRRPQAEGSNAGFQCPVWLT